MLSLVIYPPVSVGIDCILHVGYIRQACREQLRTADIQAHVTSQMRLLWACRSHSARLGCGTRIAAHLQCTMGHWKLVDRNFFRNLVGLLKGPLLERSKWGNAFQYNCCLGSKADKMICLELWTDQNTQANVSVCFAVKSNNLHFYVVCKSNSCSHVCPAKEN